MSRPNLEEHRIQKSFLEWCHYQRHSFPTLDLLYAIPNGGNRSKSEAGRFKAEGVKAGMPDLCLPVPSGSYSALYVEVKTNKGRLRDSQKDRIDLLRQAGNAVVVCRDLDSFIAVILAYFKLNYLRDEQLFNVPIEEM